MLKLYVKARNYLQGKKGQAMVEYALIIALIAIGVVIALVALGTKLTGLFNNISGQLSSSTAS